MEIHSRFVSPSSLLIFASTVNKKHDSEVIRVTCYLLTRWQKFSQDALKIRFKKKNKNHGRSDQTCPGKEYHMLAT